MVDLCIRETRGRVPVIAGAGSNNTAEAVALARHAEQAGADAVLVGTPYYNRPGQEGLYRHFKAVNDAVGIPIIIYNIPPRSVIDMSVETMQRLYELPNIVGVKDATANLARVSLQRPIWRPADTAASRSRPTLRLGSAPTCNVRLSKATTAVRLPCRIVSCPCRAPSLSSPVRPVPNAACRCWAARATRSACPWSLRRLRPGR